MGAPVLVRAEMRQAVQRFETAADLDAADCTIEEREEYRPHLEMGSVLYAGVDYAEIVSRAEAESDVIVWDGGNNDFPFIRPDLLITLVDPLRPPPPGEFAIRGAQRIDPAVPRSEEHEPLVHRGRRVDSAPGRVRPRHVPALSRNSIL